MIVAIGHQPDAIEILVLPTGKSAAGTLTPIVLRSGQTWFGHPYETLRLLGPGRHDIVVHSGDIAEKQPA